MKSNLSLSTGKVFLFVLTLFSVSPAPANAQPSYGGLLVYRFPLLTTFPPVTPDMPEDVRRTYLFGDSIARTIGIMEEEHEKRQLTYSDSLKQAVRYLFEANDYDPVTFFQWKTTRAPNRYKQLTPGAFVQDMQNASMYVFPDSGRTGVMVSADYIAVVHVDSTREGIDSTAAFARHSIKVSTTVLDKIKGQRLPNCNPAEGAGAGSGNCLHFEYALEWYRHQFVVVPSDTIPGDSLNKYRHTQPFISILPDTSLGDSTGRRWIHQDSNYVVFLSLGWYPSGKDLNHTYSDMLPIRWHGTSCGMYPIINGRVDDPTDDFGFGVGLTVQEFTTALRRKIFSITHP